VSDKRWVLFSKRLPEIGESVFVLYDYGQDIGFLGPYIAVRQPDDEKGAPVVEYRDYGVMRAGRERFTYWCPLDEWQSQQLNPAPEGENVLAAREYPHLNARLENLCIQKCERRSDEWYTGGETWEMAVSPPLYWQRVPKPPRRGGH
jgi:hypothetical protein